MIEASHDMRLGDQPTTVTALFLENPVGSGCDFLHPALNANRMPIARPGRPRIMQAQRCPRTRLIAVTSYADNNNRMARRTVSSGVLVRLPKHVEYQGAALKRAARIIVQCWAIGFMPAKRIMRAGANVAINNQPFAVLKCFYSAICLTKKNAVRFRIGAGSYVGVERVLQVFDKNAAGTCLENFHHENYPQLAKVRSFKRGRQVKSWPGSRQVIHKSADSHKRAAVTGGDNV